jgi:hypothetical protein
LREIDGNQGAMRRACSSETTSIVSPYQPSADVIDLIEVNCASTSPRRKVRCHCFGSPVVAFSASSISSATYASSRARRRISARTGAAYSLRLMVRLKPYSRLCITGPGQGRCAYSLRLRRTHDGQETSRSCLLVMTVNPGFGGQKGCCCFTPGELPPAFRS